ncbi:hypothetical protein HanPSC8_Chr17g0786691 [Helianthus annuus]|nr:hypothetical protein HanPSC8_Chr17g0786691 [Helianthus annuus]
MEEEKKKTEEARKKPEEERRAEAAKQKRAAELEKKMNRKKAMEKPADVQESDLVKGPEKRPEPDVTKPTPHAHAETHDRSKVVSTTGSGRPVSSGASSGGAGGYNPNVIGAKDTVGNIYYKTYTEEERGSAPHQAPWGLKQRDTFQEFGPWRDWFLNSFTPGEVNRQRAKTHEALYRTYVIGEANARAANHQIVREWRIMLAKEKAEFKRICQKDNERAFAAQNKIVELGAKIAELTSKVEDAQAAQVARQQIEVELADVKSQLSCKDKDLQAKDVEIADLKWRLNEQMDKCESLEIDLGAERVKAATAEEARAVSAAALNVAQANYSEAQEIVANSILNAGELDRAVAALTDAARAVGYRGGYLECAQHAEEVFGQEFDVSHCSVTDQADVELKRAENAYDSLSLPVVDLVVEALKKDD